MTADAPEVLLVDDQLGVRRGIELLLRDAGMRVAGAAAAAGEARRLLRRRRFDVALVEAMLDGASTAPLIAELLRDRPGMPLVVFVGRDDAALAAAAALRAPGLVLKSSTPATIVHALAVVAAGGTYADPQVRRRLTDRRVVPARDGIGLLSPREREVLGLLADGWSGAEIAQRLYLSAETVRTHVRNAIQKLGARSRTQAVALLVAQGEGSQVAIPDGTERRS